MLLGGWNTYLIFDDYYFDDTIDYDGDDAIHCWR